MKSTLLALTTFFILTVKAQTVFTYTGTGDWTDQENWSPSYPGTTIALGDTVIISEGADVVSNTVTNNGTLTINGTYTSRSSIRNNGTFINENSYNNSSFFNNNGDAINNATWISGSFFTNEGTLTNNSEFFVNSFFVNNAVIDNQGVFRINSFFYGNNTSHNNTVNLQGIFSPGPSTSNDVGTYTFNDDVEFSFGLNYTQHLRSATEADQVNIGGTATVSGRLNVELLDEYDPVIGDSYTIITAASLSGVFEEVTFPDLGEDKAFKITYTANSVVLEVVDAETLSSNAVTFKNTTIAIYPNPTIDVLQIKGLQLETKAAVYSVLGAKLFEIDVTPFKNKIVVDQLKAGSYFLTIGAKSYRFIKH